MSTPFLGNTHSDIVIGKDTVVIYSKDPVANINAERLCHSNMCCPEITDENNYSICYFMNIRCKKAPKNPFLT